MARAGGGRSIQNNDARVGEEEREEGRKEKGGDPGPAGGKEKKGEGRQPVDLIERQTWTSQTPLFAVTQLFPARVA